MANYDSNYAIAQEISARIGVSPIPFDSVYSIALEIYNELGGEPTQFDSVYSILLGILPLVEGGIASKVIDDNVITTVKTWSSSKINSGLTLLDEKISNVKPIEEVSELPNASENKDKLFRLDNGEKDVYAAKLLSSETITTNRLPDEQQIDKAYLYTIADEPLYYKGAYHIICQDGEIDGYMWYQDFEDKDYILLSLKNAETLTNSDKISDFLMVGDEGEASVDEETKTITIPYITISVLFVTDLVEQKQFVIPATYNAPESAQIGNANLDDKGKELNWIYDGTSVTLTIDDKQFTGYKWLSADAPDDYILTDKQASNIYFYEDNGTTYCDVKCYRVSNGDATSENILYIDIPQLNAPDSEQVGNAYIDIGNGEVVYKYKGDTLCTILATEEGSEHTYYGYKWETDDNEFICFTSVKASEIYGKTTTTIYTNVDGNNNWTISGNTYEASIVFSNTLDKIVESYSTVKYQRTEITEEWDWQPLTDNATNDDIDLMFAAPESPVIKRVLMKKAKLDEETEEPAYPLSLGEGLVNVSGETMEWDGNTYYKWVLYEENGGVSSIDYSVDGEHPMIYLTTTLNPTLPFNRDSSECAYVITDGEDGYNGGAKVYPKIALFHEDGSITYEE